MLAPDRPCRAWAVRGSNPPLCASHGGGRARVGAPKGNQNAKTHGFYTQDETNDNPRETLDQLKRRQRQLERYIDDNWDNLAPDEIARLTALQGQNASRIIRIERDLSKTKSEQVENDDFNQAINEALDRLADEYGIKL